MPSTGLHLGLSTLFTRKGLLSEEQMASAITKSRQNKHALVSTLVQSKLISARAIAELSY